MDQAFLIPLIGPASALLFGAATLAITQLRATRAEARAESRAQQSEERAAAKETVELLATQNRTLLAEIADLRDRVSHIERERKALSMELKTSEKHRSALMEQVARLSEQLNQATQAIRQDLATNAELSRAALGANDASA